MDDFRLWSFISAVAFCGQAAQYAEQGGVFLLGACLWLVMFVMQMREWMADLRRRQVETEKRKR
jgi:hypothetical protein